MRYLRENGRKKKNLPWSLRVMVSFFFAPSQRSQKAARTPLFTGGTSSIHVQCTHDSLGWNYGPGARLREREVIVRCQ